MSDANQFDFSDNKAVFQSLRSTVCPCCNGQKLSGKSFCWGCYRRLDNASRSALYDVREYPDIFREALRTLTALLIKAPSK